MSAKRRLLEIFLNNVGDELSREVLSTTASVHEWQRVIRTLRQEGWQIDATQNGYILKSGEKLQKNTSRVNISNKLRYEILQRDGSKCRRCGKTIDDGIKLEVDHKLPVEWGGDNNLENLWTLCNLCNGGKKHFFSDFDQHVMAEVMKEKSGYRKILRYFQLTPNELTDPIKIEVIAGIRDWTRTLRLIREKENINIAWMPPTKEFPSGGYIYEK